jgi:hypothetical protein
MKTKQKFITTMAVIGILFSNGIPIFAEESTDDGAKTTISSDALEASEGSVANSTQDSVNSEALEDTSTSSSIANSTDSSLETISDSSVTSDTTSQSTIESSQVEDTKEPSKDSRAVGDSFDITVADEIYTVTFTDGSSFTDPYTATVKAPEAASQFIDLDLKNPEKKAQANQYQLNAFEALMQACAKKGMGTYVDFLRFENIKVADFSDYDTSPLIALVQDKTNYLQNKLTTIEWVDMIAGDGLLKNVPTSVKIQKILLPKAKRIGNYFMSSATGGTVSGSKLEAVYAPVVTEIGDYAFAGQTALTRFLKTADSAISGGSGKDNLFYLPTLEKLGKYAFRNVKTFEYLDMPNLTIMEEGAFEGCIQLKGELSNGVTLWGGLSASPLQFPKLKAIPARAFYGCTQIIQISAPAALSIGDYAFYNCSNLGQLLVRSVESIGHVVLGMDVGGSASSYPLTSIALPNIKSIETDSFAKNTNFHGILTSLRNLNSSDTDAVRANLPKDMILYAFPDYEKYGDNYFNVGDTPSFEFIQEADRSQGARALYNYIVLKQPNGTTDSYEMNMDAGSVSPGWYLFWNAGASTWLGADQAQVDFTIVDNNSSSLGLNYPGFYQGRADLYWKYANQTYSGLYMVMFTGESKPVNRVILDIHNITATQGDTFDFIADVTASEDNVNLQNATLSINYPSDNLALGKLKITQDGQDITGNASYTTTDGKVVVKGINAKDVKTSPIKITFEGTKATDALEKTTFSGNIMSDALYDTDDYTVEILKGGDGILSLLWVPETFDFGSHSLAGLTDSLFGTKTDLPAYVVVSDMRDETENSAWKVELSSDNLKEKKSGKELSNISYTFAENTLKEYHSDDDSVPPSGANIAEAPESWKTMISAQANLSSSIDNSSVAMSANDGVENGKFAFEINKASLSIGDLSQIDGNNYEGSLTWTLVDAL